MCYELALIVKKEIRCFQFSLIQYFRSECLLCIAEGVFSSAFCISFSALHWYGSVDLCNIHGVHAQHHLYVQNSCSMHAVFLQTFFISIGSRSSHSNSGNCFNMQLNWPNRQIDFTFVSCLDMLKQLTDIWQCCKSNRDCMSFLKYSHSPTAPVADCWIYLYCVLRPHSGSFGSSDSAFSNFKIVRGTLQVVQE